MISGQYDFLDVLVFLDEFEEQLQGCDGKEVAVEIQDRNFFFLEFFTKVFKIEICQILVAIVSLYRFLKWLRILLWFTICVKKIGSL